MEHLMCPPLRLRILVSDQIVYQGEPEIAINTNLGRWEILCPIKLSSVREGNSVSNVTIVVYWEPEIDDEPRAIWRHTFASPSSQSKREIRFALPSRIEGELITPDASIRRFLGGLGSAISCLSLTSTDVTFLFDFSRFLENSEVSLPSSF